MKLVHHRPPVTVLHALRLLLIAGLACLATLPVAVDAQEQGCIEGDCTNGEGTVVTPAGTVFEGRFVDGRPDGPGRHIDWSGNIWRGQWTDGVAAGPFEIETELGLTWVGEVTEEGPVNGEWRTDRGQTYQSEGFSMQEALEVWFDAMVDQTGAAAMYIPTAAHLALRIGHDRAKENAPMAVYAAITAFTEHESRVDSADAQELELAAASLAVQGATQFLDTSSNEGPTPPGHYALALDLLEFARQRVPEPNRRAISVEQGYALVLLGPYQLMAAENSGNWDGFRDVLTILREKAAELDSLNGERAAAIREALGTLIGRAEAVLADNSPT